MTPMPAKPDPWTEETWTYAGLRTQPDGSPTHAWQDPITGDLRYYTSRKKFFVGGRYTRKIERTDGKVYAYGDPVFTGSGDPIDDDTRLEWEIKSESAERKAAAKAAEAKAKRTGGIIDEACEPLLDLARRCRTFEDVDRLANSVTRRLYDAWGSR